MSAVMQKAAAILALLLTFSAAAQQPRFTDPERAKKLAAAFPEIEKAFDKWVKDRHMPAASMGVIIDGELAWVKVHGAREVNGQPVTLDTPFRIASMTKSFTALAILKLRDEGKLSLDDPAAKYVPELAGMAYPTKDSPPITVRHLLSHGEGFPEDNPWGDRQLAQPNETISAWMKAGIPFSTPPGTTWEYSNYGFAILGQIVERVAKQPYDKYVEQHILKPLGMTASTFDIPANGVKGYRWQDNAWVEEPILAHGSFGAMGGLWTSTRDLARYVSYHLAAWPARDDADNGPVRRSSVREMQQSARSWSTFVGRQTVDAPLEMTSNAYGYGLSVMQDCRFGHVVQHGGGLPGYGSLMTWLPEHGVGLIAMSGFTYGGWRGAFNEALDAMKKTGALQPRVWPASPVLLAMQSDASKLITKWDDALANRIAADNFFLDRSADRRKKQFAELAAAHGNCRSEAITPQNLLRGNWKMTCDRGFLNVWMTLAPTNPPLLQFLHAQGIMPPDAEMQKRVDAVVALSKAWDAEAAAKLVTKDVDVEKLRRQLAEVASHWGVCKMSETVGGDGATSSIVKLTCDRGSVAVFLDVDKESKKLSSVRVVPGSENTCVP